MFQCFLSAELISDRTMKNLFESIPLDQFWLQAETEYTNLGRKAIDKLLQFSTTYLCESAFSSMTIIKTKIRNRLDAEHAMLLAISNIQRRIDELSRALSRRKHTFK